MECGDSSPLFANKDDLSWQFTIAKAAQAIWCGWQIVSRIVPLLGSSIQPAYAARSLERDMPEMKQALTSYVTLRDERQQSGLRSRVEVLPEG